MYETTTSVGACGIQGLNLKALQQEMSLQLDQGKRLLSQPPVHEDSVGASQSPQECGCSLTLGLHLQQPGSLVRHLSAKLLSEKFSGDHFAF